MKLHNNNLYSELLNTDKPLLNDGDREEGRERGVERPKVKVRLILKCYLGYTRNTRTKRQNIKRVLHVDGHTKYESDRRSSDLPSHESRKDRRSSGPERTRHRLDNRIDK